MTDVNNWLWSPMATTNPFLHDNNRIARRIIDHNDDPNRPMTRERIARIFDEVILEDEEERPNY